MGRPTKYVMSYEEQIWDNYSPYVKPKEYNEQELYTHKQEIALKRLQKAYTMLSELAGYEESKTAITIISKKALGNV